MFIKDPATGIWVNTNKPGGRVFFVGGGTTAARGKSGTGIGASDINDGQDPNRPLATIAQGHTLATAGRGDTIVLLPGSVTITAAIAITKADVTLTGYTVTGPNTRNPSLIICATNTVEMIDVDAANVTVENLTLDHNTTTAAVPLIDVGGTTASPDCIIRNVFIDMEGSGTTTDAIRMNSTTAGTGFLIEGCTIHDFDQDGIVVQDTCDFGTIRNCKIYDTVTANAGRYGIDCAGEQTHIVGNWISNNGTACINLNGTENAAVGNHLHAYGANNICILHAASSTGYTGGNYLLAVAAGNLVDFTTSATSPSADASTGNVYASDPALAALTAATVDGT